MFVVEVVLGVIVVLVVAVALAAFGDGLPAAPPDTNDPFLPGDGLLTSADLASVRFRTAAYGYRMEDVDATMAAVHAALWAREQHAVVLPAETTGEGAG